MRTASQKACMAIFLFALMMASTVYGNSCSPKDAQAADALIDNLDSWEQIAEMARKFSQCDDGSIAEGISEAIARLFVDKWQTLPQLAKLIKHNSILKQFVLRHIDDTLNTADLDKIKELSLLSCPQELRSLCKDINRAVMSTNNSHDATTQPVNKPDRK